jgi:hypothetical protein
MNVDTENHVPVEEYYLSVCGSCGRHATVTSESEVGTLCQPCATIWSHIAELAPCNCPALWGRHSLQCTLRIRDRAS